MKMKRSRQIPTRAADADEDMTVIKLNVPSQGYRRFLSPDEIRARREAEARGVVAEVVQLREDQTSESCNSEISPSRSHTSEI
jgi:hypothetical protein